MTREERRALLGDKAITQIRQRVAQAPDPTPELVAELRRIWTNPGGTVPAQAAEMPLPAAEYPTAA